MQSRTSWLKTILEGQPAGARKFFWSFMLGSFMEEAQHDPLKTYTIGEVVDLMKIIGESMKEDESC